MPRKETANGVVRDMRLREALHKLKLTILRCLGWHQEVQNLYFYNDKGDEVTMVTIQAGASQHFNILAKDAYGNPTRIQDPVSSVSNELTSFVMDEDGEGVTLTSVGPVGTGQGRVDGDADLGEGVRPIFGLLDFEVVPGDAVVIEFEPGD